MKYRPSHTQKKTRLAQYAHSQSRTLNYDRSYRRPCRMTRSLVIAVSNRSGRLSTSNSRSGKSLELAEVLWDSYGFKLVFTQEGLSWETHLP